MQKLKIRSFVLVLLLAGLMLSACSSAPKVDWTVQIEAPAITPLSLSYSALAAKPQTDLKDVLMQKTTGTDSISSWRGVSLADLFKEAGAPATYTSLSVEAADGYVMEIPFSELTDAIIALQENGKWIVESDPDHGPIRLVAPTVPANRWVYALVKISVNP